MTSEQPRRSILPEEPPPRLPMIAAGRLDGHDVVTRYAVQDGAYIAYQAVGDEPLDLLHIGTWTSNLDAMWEEPSIVRYFGRLASFSRVICFDKRGTGVSDPVSTGELPTLEAWMDDARLVLDAVGTQRVAVVGDAEGGAMAMLLAATYPDRVSALVLVNAMARVQADDDYPFGVPSDQVPALVQRFEAGWGTGNFVRLTAPSVDSDERFKTWFGRYQRLAVAPGASTKVYRWILGIDVRGILSSIRTPTLVVHRTDNTYYRVEHGRYLAEHIPGARLVEVPGADCYPFNAGDPTPILDEVQAFLTGAREAHVRDRVLSTVMFTDLVGSTEQAARLGDAEWLRLRGAHDAVIRDHLATFRGHEVKTTGDGFLATFDGPARAVRCAFEISRAVQGLGLQVRSGLHTGEIEIGASDVGGIAVHIAARVMATAGAGEVVVSGTVKDLVVGSGIEFTERGVHALKGVPGEWPLYAVSRTP